MFYTSKPKKLPVDVTEAEFSKLLDYAKMRHKVAFLIAWGAGLRLSEVLNLEQRDINLKDKSIRVNQGKGKKDRIVPLPKGFLKMHLDYIPFEFKHRALQKAFRTCAEKSGLKETKPNVHFHSLRHGFGSQCLRKGINLKSIQLMMGHSNLAYTSIYLHLCPEEVLNEYREKF